MDVPDNIARELAAVEWTRKPVESPVLWLRSIEHVFDPAAGAALILRGDLDLHDAVSITCARVLVTGSPEFLDHIDLMVDYALTIWDGSKHPPMLTLDDIERGPDDCFLVTGLEDLQ